MKNFLQLALTAAILFSASNAFACSQCSSKSEKTNTIESESAAQADAETEEESSQTDIE